MLPVVREPVAKTANIETNPRMRTMTKEAWPEVGGMLVEEISNGFIKVDDITIEGQSDAKRALGDD